MTGGTEPGARLGAGPTVRLIASREVRTRLESKAYRVTTAALVAAVVIGGVLLHLVGSSQGTKHIGVTATAAGITQQIEQTATGIGLTVQTREVATTEVGDELLKDGDIDALVTVTSPQLSITVKEKLDRTLVPLFASLAQQQALVQAVTTLGGDPAQVSQQVARAAPAVTALQPAPVVDGAQIVAGYVAGILLFLALMTTGQLVSQGVVEEKSSRVVELLLSTVRPWQLMAGKVLGIGLIGLLQVVLVVAAGVGTALGLGLLDATSLNLGATALWAILWFVIGFASYSLVLAALASLVSRQEDVASVTGPVTALMVVPYVIGDQHRAVGTRQPTGRLAVLHPVLRPDGDADPDRTRRGRGLADPALGGALARGDPGARLAGRADLLLRGAALRQQGQARGRAARLLNRCLPARQASRGATCERSWKVVAGSPFGLGP